MFLFLAQQELWWAGTVKDLTSTGTLGDLLSGKQSTSETQGRGGALGRLPYASRSGSLGFQGCAGTWQGGWVASQKVESAGPTRLLLEGGMHTACLQVNCFFDLIQDKIKPSEN